MMTLQEAVAVAHARLTLSRKVYPTELGEAVCILVGEVERLRAITPSADYVSAAESTIKSLRAELEECEVLKWTASLAEQEVGPVLFGRLKWAATQHAEDQKELDRLRAESATINDANIERVAEVMKLRAENAELRALAERVVGSSHLTSDTRRSTLDEVRARLAL